MGTSEINQLSAINNLQSSIFNLRSSIFDLQSSVLEMSDWIGPNVYRIENYKDRNAAVALTGGNREDGPLLSSGNFARLY